jgi:crossover junction endodeoxyribonuclease RuvC
VECVFVAVNARSALVLGQARGAILATLGEAEVPVDELAAREVKQAVTGMGGADKRQVQAMVARLLALDRPPPQDASDALAVALCRAQRSRLPEGVRSGRSRRRSRASQGRLRGPVQ